MAMQVWIEPERRTDYVDSERRARDGQNAGLLAESLERLAKRRHLLERAKRVLPRAQGKFRRELRDLIAEGPEVAQQERVLGRIVARFNARSLVKVPVETREGPNDAARRAPTRKAKPSNGIVNPGTIDAWRWT